MEALAVFIYSSSMQTSSSVAWGECAK